MKQKEKNCGLKDNYKWKTNVNHEHLTMLSSKGCRFSKSILFLIPTINLNFDIQNAALIQQF